MRLPRPTHLCQELPAVSLWLVSVPLVLPSPAQPSLPPPLTHGVLETRRLRLCAGKSSCERARKRRTLLFRRKSRHGGGGLGNDKSLMANQVAGDFVSRGSNPVHDSAVFHVQRADGRAFSLTGA